MDNEFSPKDISDFLSSRAIPIPNTIKGKIITFSHFIPRVDLIPPEIILKDQYIGRVLGNYDIEKQLRNLGSCIHIFGNIGVPFEKTIDKIKYVSQPFGYLHETWLGKCLFLVDEIL